MLLLKSSWTRLSKLLLSKFTKYPFANYSYIKEGKFWFEKTVISFPWMLRICKFGIILLLNYVIWFREMSKFNKFGNCNPENVVKLLEAKLRVINVG